MKKSLIFLLIFLPIFALLTFSLTRNPRDLPSALVGQVAPDFSLSVIDGGSVSLSDAKGSPVVLNFWSTWCPSCLGEHQLIRQAQQRFEKNGILFYSVLYEDTVENAKEFTQQYGKAAPILLDPGLKTAINYGVSGVPETFFIDRQGIIRYKHAGILTPEVLSEQMQRLTEPAL